VLLIGARTPGSDATLAGRIVASITAGSDVRALMLTAAGLDGGVRTGLQAGASGFLHIDAEPSTVVDAVRLVASAAGPLESAVAGELIGVLISGGVDGPPGGAPGNAPGSGESGELARLTGREREVLRLAACGLSNAEIAGELVVGTSTVKTHMNALLGKLKLRDRVQATIFAYETGLVRPGAGNVRAR
jgi:DNA-binding NarL/FixJ family response regulator